jgi:glycosyltransferase involved in cell wall biosynthesis
VARWLRVPVERMHVIEHAPPSGAPAVSQNRADDLLRGRGIDRGGYLLSIATLEPRKNTTRLIRAFERISDERPHLRLVLAGGRGWHTDRIDRAIRTSRARDRIVVTGYVTEEEHAALLGGCALFAYPSLYEGYGLPVIEAMQAGAPVLTSSVSSLPEAAGGAAVLVDPLRVDDMARGLREALDREAELRAAGRERAAKLSWDRAAAETLAVYDDAFR